FAGTRAGIVQLPPPEPLQPLDARHCACAVVTSGVVAVAAAGTERFGFVQPMVSKPVVRTLLCTPATPTSTPNVSPKILLPMMEPRPPQSSAFVFFVPWKPNVSC